MKFLKFINVQRFTYIDVIFSMVSVAIFMSYNLTPFLGFLVYISGAVIAGIIEAVINALERG